MHTSRVSRFSSGYTLIELTMGVVVLGLLAVLAFNMYRDAVLKSRRNEAQAGLAKLQMEQERWRASNPNYASASELALPKSPESGHYEWSIPLANATSYLLRATATATGAQDKDRQGQVDCKVLEVDQDGQHTPNECWR